MKLIGKFKRVLFAIFIFTNLCAKITIQEIKRKFDFVSQASREYDEAVYYYNKCSQKVCDQEKVLLDKAFKNYLESKKDSWKMSLVKYKEFVKAKNKKNECEHKECDQEYKNVIEALMSLKKKTVLLALALEAAMITVIGMAAGVGVLIMLGATELDRYHQQKQQKVLQAMMPGSEQEGIPSSESSPSGSN